MGNHGHEEETTYIFQPPFSWIWLVQANGMQPPGHLQGQRQVTYPGVPFFPFSESWNRNGPMTQLQP